MTSLGKIIPAAVAYVFVSAVLSLSAWGTTFQGTITETITDTNDPTFTVGQTFFGAYQYESATADGDFGPEWYTVFNPTALPTLQFTVFSFVPIGQDGWLSLDQTNYQGLTHLVVTDDVVTDFFMTGQYGGTDPNFRFAEFYVSDGMNNVGGHLISTNTVGTMNFSNPTPVPEGSVSTASLVACSLLCLVWWRNCIGMKQAVFMRKS